MYRMNFPLMATLLLLASVANAAEWGDLSGTFLYDGKAPTPAKAAITQDIPYCSKYNVMDESLVVNPPNGGIANIVTYVYVSRTGTQPAVHPDYEKTAKTGFKLDNSKCRFEPRISITTSDCLEKRATGGCDREWQNDRSRYN